MTLQVPGDRSQWTSGDLNQLSDAVVEMQAVANSSLAVGNTAVLSNPVASGLKTYRQSLRDVRDKAAKARLFLCGDSIFYGLGATNKETDNVQVLLKEMLSAYVGPAYDGLLYLISNAITGGNKRSFVTLGAGWTTAAGFNLGGRSTLNAPAGTVASADIGPFYCDSFTVWYMRRATTGNFDLAVDGGATISTVGGSGADALLTATVAAGTVGNHTLNIRNVVTNQAIIMMVEPTVGGGGTGAGIYISNGGVPSAATSDWTSSFGSNPWSTDQIAWVTPQPTLSVIGLGTNDYANGVAVATFQSQLDTIVVKALTYGSVLLVVEPQRTDVTGTFAWSQYVAAIKTVAANRSCAVLDIGALWNNTIAAYDSGDHVHPTTEGHYSIARAIHWAITNG